MFLLYSKVIKQKTFNRFLNEIKKQTKIYNHPQYHYQFAPIVSLASQKPFCYEAIPYINKKQLDKSQYSQVLNRNLIFKLENKMAHLLYSKKISSKNNGLMLNYSLSAIDRDKNLQNKVFKNKKNIVSFFEWFNLSIDHAKKLIIYFKNKYKIPFCLSNIENYYMLQKALVLEPDYIKISSKIFDNKNSISNNLK